LDQPGGDKGGRRRSSLEIGLDPRKGKLLDWNWFKAKVKVVLGDG